MLPTHASLLSVTSQRAGFWNCVLFLFSFSRTAFLKVEQQTEGQDGLPWSSLTGWSHRRLPSFSKQERRKWVEPGWNSKSCNLEGIRTIHGCCTCKTCTDVRFPAMCLLAALSSSSTQSRPVPRSRTPQPPPSTPPRSCQTHQDFSLTHATVMR